MERNNRASLVRHDLLLVKINHMSGQHDGGGGDDDGDDDGSDNNDNYDDDDDAFVGLTHYTFSTRSPVNGHTLTDDAQHYIGLRNSALHAWKAGGEPR